MTKPKLNNRHYPKLYFVISRGKSMNAFLTRPVLEHAISVHASPTPSNAAKTLSGRLLTNSLAFRRHNLPCRANAALRWIYPGIYQSVTYFPDLVTTSGERIFNAYWS